MKAIPDNPELQQQTQEIISQLLEDGSDPDALYIIEHHISHYDFDKLEKIAVDVFKAGYEVSDAEEFQDEEGKLLFSFDAISEIELNAELISTQQQELIPIISKLNGIYDGWGTYFEDPNATDDEYGEDGEFFDDLEDTHPNHH